MSQYLRSSAALIVLLALSGCGFVSGASYQPPVLPLVFSVDSAGKFAVKLGRGVTTPIGRFGVEAGMETPDEKEMIVAIARYGGVLEDRFKVKGRIPVAVCSDGPSVTYISPGIIRVTAQPTTTTVRVVDPPQVRAQCQGGSPAPTAGPAIRSVPGEPSTTERLNPAMVPTTTVGLLGRLYRMAMVDSPAETELGMKDWTRADLGYRSGMLYVYPSPNHGYHVLSGYRFTTDVLFFDAYGRFLAGFTGRPCAWRSPYCLQYSPGIPFSYVIEAPNGNLPILRPGAMLILR